MQCFFVFQTDLDGIKWRKLGPPPESVYTEPLEDPVLLSYTRCIKDDILCVWRKVQKSSEQKPPDQLSSSKELWIFWYGDEPHKLKSLLHPDLKGKQVAP